MSTRSSTVRHTPKLSYRGRTRPSPDGGYTVNTPPPMYNDRWIMYAGSRPAYGSRGGGARSRWLTVPWIDKPASGIIWSAYAPCQIVSPHAHHGIGSRQSAGA